MARSGQNHRIRPGVFFAGLGFNYFLYNGKYLNSHKVEMRVMIDFLNGKIKDKKGFKLLAVKGNSPVLFTPKVRTSSGFMYLTHLNFSQESYFRIYAVYSAPKKQEGRYYSLEEFQGMITIPSFLNFFERNLEKLFQFF